MARPWRIEYEGCPPLVEPVDGNWKITGFELLEEKRIDPYGAAKSK
jgi:hypothetical protein